MWAFCARERAIRNAGGEVTPSDKPGCMAFSIRQPAGVVLGIAPWNAPVILGAQAIATPVACGNTAVFKGSGLCPRTHELIAEAFEAAGLPEGAVSFVSNAPNSQWDPRPPWPDQTDCGHSAGAGQWRASAMTCRSASPFKIP